VFFTHTSSQVAAGDRETTPPLHRAGRKEADGPYRLEVKTFDAVAGSNTSGAELAVVEFVET
jgi:hypothetical protein